MPYLKIFDTTLENDICKLSEELKIQILVSQAISKLQVKPIKIMFGYLKKC